MHEVVDAATSPAGAGAVALPAPSSAGRCRSELTSQRIRRRPPPVRAAGAVVISRLRDRVGGIRVVRASGRYLESPYASIQLMLAAGGGLLFFGLLMSASTTISASVHTTGDAPWAQLIREVQFIVLSVPVFWLAVRMSPAAYRRVAYPALGLALCALVGVLVPGIGVTVNGAHRWIQLGPLTVQPSEFAKFAILLWGADLLARKESLRTLTTARHVLIPLVPGFVVVIGLVMLEPDLGTSLCFMLLLLGLLWMVGLPYRYFAGLLVAVAGAVTVLAVTESYRMERLTTFLHPNLDPAGRRLPHHPGPVRAVQRRHRRRRAGAGHLEVRLGAQRQHRLRLRGGGRGTRPARLHGGARPVRAVHLRRDADRASQPGPVRPAGRPAAPPSGSPARR